MKLDGSDLKNVEGYVKPEMPAEAEGGSFWINNMCATPDGGFAIIENVYYSIPVSAGDGSGDESGTDAAEGSVDAGVTPLAATSSDVAVAVPEPMPGGDEQVEYTSVQKYNLRVFDAAGNEKLCIDLSSLTEDSDYFYVSAFAVDGQGNTVLMTGRQRPYHPRRPGQRDRQHRPQHRADRRGQHHRSRRRQRGRPGLFRRLQLLRPPALWT